ncbi:MAG: hypothetical protein GF416_03140 [Candidatus Altiarchaeales archaeon]|nr:hypothetical protein [Candidatus Altiarchaeales archaeon]MBD3416115.1 hypothetical protein [Candidatus Altiarchaeales archaeon]
MDEELKGYLERIATALEGINSSLGDFGHCIESDRSGKTFCVRTYKGD